MWAFWVFVGKEDKKSFISTKHNLKCVSKVYKTMAKYIQFKSVFTRNI